jgi:hypothetical protein
MDIQMDARKLLTEKQQKELEEMVKQRALSVRKDWPSLPESIKEEFFSVGMINALKAIEQYNPNKSMGSRIKYGEFVAHRSMSYFAKKEWKKYCLETGLKHTPMDSALPDISDQTLDLSLLLSCCRDIKDYQIVRMIRQGYSDGEIALALKVQKMTIWRRRQRLGAAVLEKMKQNETQTPSPSHNAN